MKILYGGQRTKLTLDASTAVYNTICHIKTSNFWLVFLFVEEKNQKYVCVSYEMMMGMIKDGRSHIS